MRIECLPLWERINAAGLLEPAQVNIIRAEVMSWKSPEYRSLGTESPDPTAVAAAQSRLLEWLVSHELLTDYQSQVLLQGAVGPLEIGPFRLVGQVRDFGLPHHYWVVAKRRSHEMPTVGDLPQALVIFGHGLTPTDWTAIQRRAGRFSKEKNFKSPHLVATWGSVVAQPYCGVLTQPCLTERSVLPNGSASQTEPGEAMWTSMTLAQRFSPAYSAANPAPSTKRVLQWGLDLAQGLAELHERDLALGFWDPTSVLISSSKRAVLFDLPGVFLRTPLLAGLLFDGVVPTPTANRLYEALGGEAGANWPWTPRDFLAPEIVQRIDSVIASRKEKTAQDLATGPRGWATPAADSYCLGTVLSLLLNVASPGGAQSSQQRMVAKLQPQANPLPVSVPGPIRSLVEKLTSSDPLQRPSAADAMQNLRGLLKQSVEPAQPLFAVSVAGNQWRDQCRKWPGGCWTKEVEAIKASEIPELVKPADLFPVVIQTNPSSTLERESRLRSAEGARDDGHGSAPRTRFRERQRPKSFWSPPMVACLISGGAAMLFLIWWMVAGPETTKLAEQDAPEKIQTPSPAENEVVPTRPTGWKQEVVPDDGRLLWESPTVGLPLTVDGLPNNPSGLLVLDQGFWKSRSVGPLVRALEGSVATGYAQAIQEWRTTFQVEQFSRSLIAQYQSLERVQNVVLLDGDQPVELSLAGWKLVASCEIPTSLVDAVPPANPNSEPSPDNHSELDLTEKAVSDSATAKEPVFHYLLAREAGQTVEAIWLQLAEPLAADLLEGLASASLESVSEETFDPSLTEIVLDARKLPVRRMLIGAPQLIGSAVQSRGQTQFAGTMASLLGYSDRDRQLQLFVNPVTIWNAQGQDWLGARWQWLGQLVKDHVPTAVRMMYLSVHSLDTGETYAEVKVVGDRARPVDEVLGPMMDELSQMPEAVKRSLLGLPRVSYWENALLRYDSMLQDVSGFVRAGQHDRVPTLNAWLRPNAVENLLATTEIYFLAIGAADGVSVATDNQVDIATPDVSSGTPANLAELLRAPRSLSIPEQDLINALVELETEVKTAYPELPFEFSIELDGNSLRLEGITQNQKITNFEQKNRPLAEILTALVLKANPDPAVTSARDPKCKLIWLIDPVRPDGQIRVTTRAAAQESGLTLPPELLPE